MDLQKVAIPANSNASQNSQRSETGEGEGDKFGLPLADMIRVPLISVGDLFSSLAAHPISNAKPSEDHYDRDANDHAPTDEAVSRKDAPDNSHREDNTRANDPEDDRVEKVSSRDDKPRDEHEPRDNREDHAAADDAPSDDVAKNPADEPDSTVADSSDEDTNTDATAVAATETTHRGTAETVSSNNPGFETALASLIGVAQGSDQNQTVKDAAQTLTDVVAGPKATKVSDAPVQQVTSNGAGTQQDDGSETQQALRQVVRQGTGPPNNAADAANKSTDQTLAQQQAKMLSDRLKSDKPVKVTVNTENRANVAISQPSQSLSTNALAAQNGETSARTTADPQSNARPAQLQPNTQNMASQNAAQAQAAAQASNAVAASTGERGIARAMIQTSAGQHGVGGTEASSGTTATTPGTMAQQAAATQKPQQAQAPRAAQQPQPLTQQISVNITKAIAEGMDRITIQLRPAELGRVEVKLEVGKNGRVSAQIIVDRPEALEALRNDSRDLVKALQDAGLQAHAGDLSFNLRDQQENPDDSGSDNRLAGDEEEQIDGDLEAELATRLLNDDLDGFISDTRVDIRA